MQSSPPRSEGKARAIRELSRSLNSQSPRSIPSPSPPPSDSNPTQQLDANTGETWNSEDLFMSTQQHIQDDTGTLPQFPRIRSTAKKVGAWHMLRSEQPQPDTSMVNKQFGDFDQSVSDEEDISVEQARGGRRSNRSTPGKLSAGLGDFNSLYDMTPLSARSRKSYAGDTGNLRRDAQIRRASRNDTDTRPASMSNSPAVTANKERKRASLAQLHAKVSEDESLFIEERPPTMTFQAKSTRWGNPRSRQTSLQLDGVAEDASRLNATPRSRPATATAQGTAQSFMLPDLPNLTELVSGVFNDGTPVFSKTTPARSRFAAPNNNGRAGGRQSKYTPVDSVPIPDEEKAIFASLHLLQERVSQLEHERAEAEKRIEEREVEIIELKAHAQTQEKLRRPDSGLGSTDGEGSSRSSWKVEKTRLEASVQTLQSKLQRTERKVAVAEIESKRLSSERENMATQLGVAFQNLEEVKHENQALSDENNALRQEIDNLRAENESLRDHLEQEQEQYREETIQLRRQAERTDHATQKENETLRTELTRVRTQYDENTQQLARKEVELRKARKEQAEYTQLQADRNALKERLASLKAKREQEIQRWSSREAELKSRVERRDETIRHFQDLTQEQTNEAVRHDNDNLRNELAQLAAQHEEDARRWAKKEEQMKRKVEAAREKENLTREILSVRQVNHQREDMPTSFSMEKEGGHTDGTHRKPSLRREDTRTRIANRVHEEVRNSKHAASHAVNSQKSPRKPYTNIASASNRSYRPEEFSRSFSAPVPRRLEDADSDVESTTDLSLHSHGNPYAMRRGASGMPSTVVESPAPLELTELSYIDAEQIAQLRRQLEEERANARLGASSVPSERQTREDTVRSTASVKSTQRPSLPRKSSMKDVTEKTTGTVFEDLTGNVSVYENATAEPTQTQQSEADVSMISNTSRRRRSAPIENMTSAFILPDIKMTRKEATGKIELTQKIESRAHDNDNCTVCRREGTTSAADNLHVPKLVPVSSRMPDEIDATLRPSRSPKEALALVVKELLDERAHLHIELATCRAMLESHDVSKGMKKRRAINDAIKDILERIEVKDTQIYHLYDVLEGQQDHDLTEQDVEELTHEVRVEEPEKPKKKEKKVVVQSFHGSEDGGEDLSGDEDLPWEGFEDTGSHSVNFGGLDIGRKSTVY